MAKVQTNWKKRILLPFWILRIICMLLVVFGLAVAVKRYRDERPGELTVAIGTSVAYFLFLIIVLLLDILQIVMFARGNLQPTGFLIMNSVQTAFWLIVLIMDVAEISRQKQPSWAVGFVIFIFLLFLGPFVYAIVSFNRQRKEGKRGYYAPAHNPAMVAAPTPTLDQGLMHHKGSTAYHGAMHEGGDLGQVQSLYLKHGAATDYYNEQPTKPAHMV